MNEFIQLIIAQKHNIILLHAIFATLGFTCVIISDLLFNRYVHDGKINSIEDRSLKLLSLLIWGCVTVLFISGMFLFLSDVQKYLHSVKFLTKMSIIVIIIINGYLFHRIIHPSLRKIQFVDKNNRHKYVKIRRLSFVFGAVSLFSWSLAFFLGFQESIPFSYITSMILFVSLLLVVIVISQIIERIIVRKFLDKRKRNR